MGLTQAFRGRTAYTPDLMAVSGPLFVAVSCRIGAPLILADALLDSAAEWCLLDPAVARTLGYEPDPVQDRFILSTRFGTLTGRLERIPVVLPAAEGDSLSVEATWFVSFEWLGPTVLGWKGCLERIRFALDPGDESFYFGELT